MLDNGRIAESGSFSELVASGLDFASLVSKHVGDEDEPDTEGIRVSHYHICCVLD